MQKRYLVFGLVGLVLVVGVSILFVLGSRTPNVVPQYSSQTSTQSPNQAQDENTSNTNTKPLALSITPYVKINTTPEEITKAFYSWYIASTPSPFISGTYKVSKYLTNGFKQQIIAFSRHDQSFDPILCNANKTQNFKVENASYSTLGDQSKVIVSANVPNGKHLYRFILVFTTGHWLINDIICM